MTWFLLAVAVVAGGFLILLARARAKAGARAVTFSHEGQTYTRQPDGTFLAAGGTVVAGTAAVAALGVAYQAHVARQGGDVAVLDGGGQPAEGGWFPSLFGGGGGSDADGGGSGGGGDGGGGGGD